MFKIKKLRQHPNGATVVEFAVVAPLLFATIFASIELGRALMTTQSLEEAARSACRVAVLRGSTTSEIESEVDRILAPTGVSTYTVLVQPTDVASAARWDPVSVTVSSYFADMSWLPVPKFLGSKEYTSTCTLPKEYSTGN